MSHRHGCLWLRTFINDGNKSLCVKYDTIPVEYAPATIAKAVYTAFCRNCTTPESEFLFLGLCNLKTNHFVHYVLRYREWLRDPKKQYRHREGRLV
jgi:hypothetical protein